MPATVTPGFLSPLRRVSGRVVGAFERASLAGVLSTAAIAFAIGHWIWPMEAPGVIVLALLTFVLLLPAGILFLAARALDTLAQLPESLFSQATGLERPTLSLKGGALRSVWQVGRYLQRARVVLWSLREELAAAGAVVRLASAPALLGILASAVAVGVMIPVAGALLVLAVLF